MNQAFQPASICPNRRGPRNLLVTQIPDPSKQNGVRCLRKSARPLRRHGEWRGRFELTLTSYALNQEEITLLRQELDRENLGEVLATVGGKASETLNQLLNEMESFVTEPVQTESKPDDPNPFLALFGWEDREPEREKKDATDTAHVPWWSVGEDTDVEAVIRSQAILNARRRCLDFYDRCKAALGMARF